jgi:hypothetical protein
VIGQAGENNPPNDIKRNHQANDRENEAHAENLRAFRQFRILPLGRKNATVIDRRYRRSLSAVATDRFDRATFHRLFAETFFFRRLRLFVNVGVATVVVALEIRGRSFAAQIAVDALFIDIEFAGSIFGILVGGVGHNFIR